jgi:hypothetical protein
LTTNVNVKTDGMVNYAIPNFVTRDVMNMDNVKMEHVFALPVGMESTARLKDVLEGIRNKNFHTMQL